MNKPSSPMLRYLGTITALTSIVIFPYMANAEGIDDNLPSVEIHLESLESLRPPAPVAAPAARVQTLPNAPIEQPKKIEKSKKHIHHPHTHQHKVAEKQVHIVEAQKPKNEKATEFTAQKEHMVMLTPAAPMLPKVVSPAVITPREVPATIQPKQVMPNPARTAPVISKPLPPVPAPGPRLAPVVLPAAKPVQQPAPTVTVPSAKVSQNNPVPTPVAPPVVLPKAINLPEKAPVTKTEIIKKLPPLPKITPPPAMVKAEELEHASKYAWLWDWVPFLHDEDKLPKPLHNKIPVNDVALPPLPPMAKGVMPPPLPPMAKEAPPSPPPLPPVVPVNNQALPPAGNNNPPPPPPPMGIKLPEPDVNPTNNIPVPPIVDAANDLNKKPIALTTPVQVASLPKQLPAANTADRKLMFSLNYSKNEANLSDSEKSQLDTEAKQIKNNPKRFAIVSYASSNTDQIGSDRRLSLLRAIEVRKYLITQGINEQNITVQAMGDASSSNQKDHVDIYMMNDSAVVHDTE